MGSSNIFVGRREELDQFKQVLARPDGEAVVVVGPSGMGKTWLINKMGAIAEKHPGLKCGWVRYEVTPTDGVDATMALMMDNAFEAAQIVEGSFSGTDRRREQWRSLLNVINVGDLVMSLQRDPQRNTREQFLEKLRFISKKMPKNGRAVFIVDPEKYMLKDSDQSWAIVVKDLPEKIKFVFAQRPEDVLVDSEVFDELDNVVCIPENGKGLGELDGGAVDELIGLSSSSTGQSAWKLGEVLKRYEGYPYAIGGALKLLEAGVKLEELPERPEPVMFAEKLWRKVCENGDGAMELLQAYAVLEVGVPDDVVEGCSGINSTTRKRLQNNKYLRGLLRDDGEGMRIYHALFVDYILGQMNEEETKKYHERAVGVYRGKLKKAEEEQVRPDELAAMRLPEHVLVAEGQEAFVDAFVNECTKHIFTLGLFDSMIELSERGLEMVGSGSSGEAALCVNLGSTYNTRGELDKAEEMYEKSLEIEKKLGRLDGMAIDYGNLGIVYGKRGELDKAEKMFKKSLEIEEALERLEGMARQYGNLGNVYQARGELDKAEKMFKKSLEIEEKLRRPQGMASDYGNLGGVYHMRGELDKAVEMYEKSLAMNEKLGRLEGMAIQCGNLGGIYQKLGEVDKARQYWEKSRDIYAEMGVGHKASQVQRWIDGLSN